MSCNKDWIVIKELGSLLMLDCLFPHQSNSNCLIYELCKVIHPILSQHITKSKNILVFLIASPLLVPHKGVASSMVL